MSVSGIMLGGLGKNIGTTEPLFGNAFKSALTRYMTARDLENGGIVLGGAGSYIGAAIAFVSAAKSGSRDVASTVLASISGANGIVGGSAAIGEAALYFTNGTSEAAATIGRLLGYEAGAAALETLPELGLAVVGQLTGYIGIALTLAMGISDIIKQTKQDNKFSADVLQPLYALTGMRIQLDHGPYIGGW